jgi:putative ABC transport system permease protein
MTEEKPRDATSGRPPILAERLLGAFTSSRLRDSLLGDFAEIFENDRAVYGERSARLRYWANVLISLGPLAWRWLERFLPLIWAGITRKPVRTGLTVLSATAAFMLFGLTLGFNASIRHAIDVARPDCIYIESRFGEDLILAQRDQIAKIPHVVKVGYWGWINGYYRDPKNFLGALMLDQNEHLIWSELPISDDQLKELRTVRNGVFISQMKADKLGLKAGSDFPVLTTVSTRADGSTVWPLKVLGVFNDLPTDPEGLIIGDYSYFDESLALDRRGKVSTFEARVDDPRNAEDVSRAIDALFENSSTPTRSVPEKTFYESGALSGISVSDISLVTYGTAGAGLFMMLFLIGNTITQSVRERIPEFALMRAVGYSHGALTSLILIEAAAPILMGAAMGLPLAFSATLLWHRVIPISWAMPVPYISPLVIALAIASALLVAGACALVPTIRLRRMDLASILAGR